MTAGETAPSGRIDLSTAVSAMDVRANVVRDLAVSKVRAVRAAPQPEDRVPCRCGARGVDGYGYVPRWFGRDCIEVNCPLKGAARG